MQFDPKNKIEMPNQKEDEIIEEVFDELEDFNELENEFDYNPEDFGEEFELS